MSVKHRLKHTIKCFWADERGATAIEYALIAGGIVLAIVGTVQNLGSTVFKGNFSLLSSEIRK